MLALVGLRLASGGVICADRAESDARKPRCAAAAPPVADQKLTIDMTAPFSSLLARGRSEGASRHGSVAAAPR